jgi:hypothetical protein
MDDDPYEGAGFWGIITNASDRVLEFHLKFNISNLEPVESAKFFFSLPFSNPPLPPDTAMDLEIAVYGDDTEAASTDNFGQGERAGTVSIEDNKRTLFSIDVTQFVNDYIDNDEINFLGIRLYGPVYEPDPAITAQLLYGIGYLGLTTDSGQELEDTMHPTGAVHAHPKMDFPHSKEIIAVKFTGYVFDELSALKDGQGFGVSEAFLEIDNHKIVLKDDSVNLLDENGRFETTALFRKHKLQYHKIKLYAADTNLETPNFGVVDSTKIKFKKFGGHGRRWGYHK